MKRKLRETRIRSSVDGNCEWDEIEIQNFIESLQNEDKMKSSITLLLKLTSI